MTSQDWDELSVNQARAEAETLAARLRALHDILSATKDAAQQATIKAQLIDLDAQWVAAVAQRDRLNENVPKPPKANGDIDALKRQVVDLGRALATDKPDEAHAIIGNAIDALIKLDGRLGRVESRVAVLERHVNPPWQVNAWRLIALFWLLFAGTLFWVKDSRDLLFGDALWAGMLLESVLIMLILVCLLLANAKLREHKA